MVNASSGTTRADDARPWELTAITSSLGIYTIWRISSGYVDLTIDPRVDEKAAQPDHA
jgi:hypothetical protein